ncbi:formimidoyltransferase-cyclodeaminase [Pristis pectinata]|uniref:formimidoyltransferase-cyclodeaminase n=1 Tax=Pristis pectinata TaxID=685728 RepID=UPI00223E48E8|nr:formimidoyltransferase-cyclodeaminase [Pristis pectinata]
MAKLVECVPNFSNGQSKMVIDAIADAISQTEGCSLLDVDPGQSTNRTVYTFVGSPEAAVNGALNAAQVAFQLIDMVTHKGEHPRLGALDVCPFIPVRNVHMEECVRCANEFGKRLAEKLEVPVYLYGEAARDERRRTLPSIRAGEYEGLREKLQNPDWAPDFGAATFVPRWGATVTGARNFLIAYNINLLSTKEQAHRLALNIREQGRGKDQPGRLNKVQAIGWYLEEANIAQVSTNLLDFEVTALHTVFEEVRKDAEDLDLPVVGSQIVGLIPLKAMMDAAEFYMKKENLFILEEEHKIRLVISRLGLDSLAPFNAKERIIEYMVRDEKEEGCLVSLPLQEFIQSVGARTAAPGGGSVAAAVAAMGAALGSMVGLMTYGKRQFEHLDGTMRRLIAPFHHVMAELISLVDDDSNAFNSYMAALKMPKLTSVERERREAAMQDGLKKAVLVPLALAERVTSLWPHLREMATFGNIGCKSDLQVAAKALELGVFGAFYNIMTNLKDIKEEEFNAKTRQKAYDLLEQAKWNTLQVLELIDKRKELGKE